MTKLVEQVESGAVLEMPVEFPEISLTKVLEKIPHMAEEHAICSYTSFPNGPVFVQSPLKY